MKTIFERQRYRFKLYKNIKYNFTESIVHNNNVLLLNDIQANIIRKYRTNKSEFIAFSENTGLIGVHRRGKEVLLAYLEHKVINMRNNIADKIINYQVLLKISNKSFFKEKLFDILMKEYNIFNIV
jgi:hypothetical protein